MLRKIKLILYIAVVSHFVYAASPVVTSTATTTSIIDSEYDYTIIASDSDGDDLNWSVKSGTSLPSWLSFGTNEVTTFAGKGGYGTADGNSTTAQFYSLKSLTVDSDNNIYVSDGFASNIRKVSSSGDVTTFAGTALSAGTSDGNGLSAQFASPEGILMASDGNIYIADSANNLIRKMTLNGEVTTFAGVAGITGANNGDKSVATFYKPYGIAEDSSGNFYVTDGRNFLIRKISSSGEVSTLAGSGADAFNDDIGTAASFRLSIGIVVDSNDNIYVADYGNNRIRKITQAGVVSTFAGSGVASSLDGNGVAATFKGPWELTIDSSDNIYVTEADGQHVRKITPSADVTTIAGNGTPASVDGNGTSASFYTPEGIIIDSNNNLYVGGLSSQKLRKIRLDTRLYGTPTSADTGIHNVSLVVSDGVNETEHTFQITVGQSGPTSNNINITIDEDTDKIFSTNDFNFTSPTGNTSLEAVYITTLESEGNLTLSGSEITLNQKILTSDISNLKFSPVSNANGTPYSTFKFKINDGESNSSSEYIATINVNAINDAAEVKSTAVTTGAKDTLYSYTLNASDIDGDDLNWSVKSGTSLPSWLSLNSPNGSVIVSTLAGTGSPGSTNANGTSASFKYQAGIAVDSSGNVYVAGTTNHLIRKIDTNGDVTTLAGTAGRAGATNANGTSALFNNPYGVAVDNSGNVYVADTTKHLIRKIDTNGDVTTLAGTAGSAGSTNANGTSASFNAPKGVAVDNSGNVYVADYNNHLIRKIDTNGDVTTLAGTAENAGSTNANGISASFNNPHGVAVDSSGNVYVADTTNQLIRKIDTNGDVTTLAGTTESAGLANANGTSALFNAPKGVAVDNSGNVYVADYNNHLIRKIDTNGDVTTLAGTAGSSGSTNGDGTSSSFNKPYGVSVDSSGNVYVADTFNHLIRKITINNSSILSGTPTATNGAQTSQDVNLTLSDGNTTVSHNFTINLTGFNNPTTFNTLSVVNTNDKAPAVSPFSALELTDTDSTAFTATIALDDNTKGTLSTTSISSGDLSTVQSALRAVTFTPTANKISAGLTETTTITVSVIADGNNAQISNTVVSTSIDDAPTLNQIAVQSIQEDATKFNITLVSNDADGDSISYTVKSSDTDKVTVSIVDGKIVVTPLANAYGIVNIEVNATANGKTTSKNFNVDISEVNDAPSIDTTFSNMIIAEDNGTKSYDLNVSDIDGNELNVTVESNNTDILKVSSNWSGLLTQGQYNEPLDFNLTTVQDANGLVKITVKVVDENNAMVSQNFDINVSAVNDAPTLSTISDKVAYINFKDKNITLPLTDVDEDVLKYSVNVENTSLIDTQITNNILTIKSKENQTGNVDINLTVSDSEYNVSKVFNFKIISLKINDNVKDKGQVQVDENGTVVVRFEDDNITIKAPTKADINGSISHEININGIKVQATSEINGSIVEPTTQGVHTIFEDNVSHVVAEANATVIGKATHSLTKNGKTTKAVSNVIGASTTISKDVDGIHIKTSVNLDTDTNTTAIVVANDDGSASHEVKGNGFDTIMRSTIEGTQTTIEDNNITTMAGNKPSDCVDSYIKANIVTSTNGKTKTKFSKFNCIDDSFLNDLQTVEDMFERDNNITVEKNNITGLIEIITVTPVDTNLQF